MANTIITTDRTIEISDIDSDYILDPQINVESVVLIPGADDDKVEIREYYRGSLATSPAKTLLHSGNGEPRTQYFRQRVRVCFEFATATLTAGAKIIINIGE